MLTLYGDMLSGNCYKIKLLMLALRLEHEWVHLDIMNDETHTSDFEAQNPNGKIPLLEITSEQETEYLAESNAILNYLAHGTSYLPSDPLKRAKVLQWQCFEQYSHEPFIATARYINLYLGLPTSRLDEYHAKQDGGIKALTIMDKHLAKNEYFVGNERTIADISLYAYTHVAHEGDFDLSSFNNIQRWFRDIEDMPGYVAMSRENG